MEEAKVEDILTSPIIFPINKVIHLMKEPSGTPMTSQERPSRVCHRIRTCLNFFKTKTHKKRSLRNNKRKISKMMATMTKRIMVTKIMMKNTARNSYKSSPKTQRNHAGSI
jgi:hypothetical protein